MFDDWAWKSYNKVIKEAKEPTPFKSAAQKRYKNLEGRMIFIPPKGATRSQRLALLTPAK